MAEIDNNEPEMRYKTFKDLVEAYRTGELTVDTPLTLDNDCSYVYVGEECVYRGPGYEIREDALTALGIPWEHC